MNILTKGNSTCIVDIWAKFCGPCQMLKPILKQLENEYTNLNVVYIDVEEDSDFSEIKSEYKIKSIPTLFFIRDNEIVERVEGFIKKEILVEKINKYNII